MKTTIPNAGKPSKPPLPPAAYVAGAAAGRQWAERLATFDDLASVKSEIVSGQPPLFTSGFFAAAVAVLAELDTPIGLANGSAHPPRRTRVANSRRA